jgi:trans-aconitate methyltransferase
MSFYHDAKNVADYIASCTEYDGVSLERIIQGSIPMQGTLLELGAGPGNDIPFLNKHFDYTGSDCSEPFLVHLRRHYPTHHFVYLEATSLPDAPKFDVIYSNKVLHHLDIDELKQSLEQQREKLNPKGWLVHTFWAGERFEVFHELHFQYYKQPQLQELFERDFKVVNIESYGEFAKKDSLVVIAQLKS